MNRAPKRTTDDGDGREEAMEKFRVPVLVTLDSGEEDVRTFSVEAESMTEAIEIAERQARLDENVVEVKAQVR